jgi:hypothetical protein
MDSSVIVPDDWRDRPTLSVPVAGAILGIGSRGSSYRAARLGQIPTIQLGCNKVVPVAKLRRMLGELTDEAASS